MVVEPEIDTIDDDLYSGSVIKYFKKDQKEEKKRERLKSKKRRKIREIMH